MFQRVFHLSIVKMIIFLLSYFPCCEVLYLKEDVIHSHICKEINWGSTMKQKVTVKEGFKYKTSPFISFITSDLN